MIRKRDWLWLLLLPVYLVISTYRHEAAHAIVATAQGAEVLKFNIIPSIYENGKFYFGYVVWQGGEPNWLVDAAPYFMDILTYALFFPIVQWVRFPWHGLWLNTVIVGLFSPIVNSFYNYVRGNDVKKLLADLPNLLVHISFLLGLGLAILGLVLVMTRSAQAKAERN